MDKTDEARPGSSGRRWQSRLTEARLRKHGAASAPGSFEAAIARGVAGEEQTGMTLDAVVSEHDLAAMHDLALPGERANIDHLVVGRGGVYVIDSKNWNGPVRIGRKTMWSAGKSRYKHLKGVVAQTERVRTALNTAGHPDVPVHGLLCMVNNNRGVPIHGLQWVQAEESQVGVGRLAAVVQYIQNGGSLDVQRMRQISDTLRSSFIVSGGARTPSLAPPGQEAPAELTTRVIERASRGAKRARARRIAKRCVAYGLIALVALVMIGIGGATLQSLTASMSPMTRAELKAMSRDIQSAAEVRAGGRVRGPSVRTKPRDFVLIYRRGTRCRVRITVNRYDESITVGSAGCASKRR